MERAVALVMGIVAWLLVGVVAIISVEVWSDDNQVLAFIPIALSVVAAWAIGEIVTERVFTDERVHVRKEAGQ